MIVEGRCDNCGHPYKVDELFIGKTAMCQQCGYLFDVSRPDDKPSAWDTDLAMPAIVEPTAEPALVAAPAAPPDEAAAAAEAFQSAGAPSLARRRRAAEPLGRNGLLISVAIFLVVGALLAGILYPLLAEGPSSMPKSSLAASRPTGEAIAGQPTGGAAVEPQIVPPAPQAADPPGRNDGGDAGDSWFQLPPPRPTTTRPPGAPKRTPPAPAEPQAERPSDAVGVPVKSPSFGTFRQLIHPAVPSDHLAVLRTGRSEVVELWRLRPYERRVELRFGNAAVRYAVSPGGAYLLRVTGVEEHAAEVWSFATGKRTARIPLGPPTMYDVPGFSTDRRLVLKRWHGIGTTLEVYDPASGAKRRELAVAAWSPGRAAFSPDGQDCAVAVAGNGSGKPQLVIYDLTDGGIDARCPLPDGGYTPAGVAYSRDGARVAVFLSGGRQSRIASFLAAGEQPDADVAVPLRFPRTPTGRTPFDWLPDGSGFAAFGHVLDARTGSRLGSLGVPHVKSQQFVAPDRFLLVSRNGRTQQVHVVRVAGAAMAEAARQVKLRVRPVVEPPELDTPAWTPAPIGRLYGGPVPWRGATEPPPKPPAPLPQASIDLDAPPGTPIAVRFGSPDCLHAVVLRNVHPVAGPQRFAEGADPTLELYDLAAGRRLHAAKIPTFSRLLDASPDATLAMVGAPGPQKDGRIERLDVYAADDGRHVTGFVPYAGRDAKERAITSAAFIDGDRILTHNGDQLVLWSIRGRRAVWAIGGAAGTPALGPTRKLIVVPVRRALRVLRSEDRAQRGDLPVPLDGNLTLHSAAFSPDGKRMAALVAAGSTVRLLEWELATGKTTRSFATGASGPLNYAGDRHLLAGGDLTDLDRERRVLAYRARQHLPGGPAGLHWYLATHDSSSRLAAVRLPRLADLDLGEGNGDNWLTALPEVALPAKP